MLAEDGEVCASVISKGPPLLIFILLYAVDFHRDTGVHPTRPILRMRGWGFGQPLHEFACRKLPLLRVGGVRSEAPLLSMNFFQIVADIARLWPLALVQSDSQYHGARSAQQLFNSEKQPTGCLRYINNQYDCLDIGGRESSRRPREAMGGIKNDIIEIRLFEILKDSRTRGDCSKSVGLLVGIPAVSTRSESMSVS